MNTLDQQAPAGFTATFEPDGKRVATLPGETVLDCARRAGVRVSSICGGRGLCKSCVVQVSHGPIAAASEQDIEYFTAEQIEQNWRRACQTFIVGDCSIEVSARAQAVPLRTQVESEDVWVHPDPVVRAFRTVVPEATLESPDADDKRLQDMLQERWPGAGHTIDIDVQRELPRLLREAKGRVTAITRFGEIIGTVRSRKGPILGLAVDVGTTNIGALLVDLRTGRTLGSLGLENPQAVHGGDVITRMSYARRSPETLQELRKLVIGGINRVAKKLCESRSLNPREIADVVAAGNTTMHHLLMGLPIDYLGKVPFVPAVSAATDCKARDLGIDIMPGAYVHLLANVAGFVGGDHTAVLLAISAKQEKRSILVLDIGTNTEISLLHDGKLMSASCPSGPALEGGHIRSGMRSAPGAIESVRIEGETTQFTTIGDAPPTGICGSGVVDIAAQIYLAGIVTESGRMLDEHPSVRTTNGKREYVLADEAQTDGQDVVFTQQDVRAVQLAKGAIRAGIQTLANEAGIAEDDIEQIIIAGAFGNYIDIESAIAIGMLPPLPADRFAQVGNAAGIGAKLALVSHAHRAEAQSIATSSHYIELAGSRGFTEVFMASMAYPDKDIINIRGSE